MATACHVCFTNTLLVATGSAHRRLWIQHRVLSLWGVVVSVSWGTFCCVVLLATGGCPTFREGGAVSEEEPCSSEKGLHCLARATPGRANHTAPRQVQLEPALNLTTNITITDPENGIRGGYTSCWRTAIPNKPEHIAV